MGCTKDSYTGLLIVWVVYALLNVFNCFWRMILILLKYLLCIYSYSIHAYMSYSQSLILCVRWHRNQHCSGSKNADLKGQFDLFPRDCMLGVLTFVSLLLSRQIAVTVVDQKKAEQRLGRVTDFCLQSALPRLFSFLLKQWNPSAASHKNCKKANSRWR